MSPLLQKLKEGVGSMIVRTGLCNRVIQVRRGPLRGNKWTFYPRTSYWRGTHEPDLVRCIGALPNLKHGTAWDLGAHYGYYSILLARKTGPTGRVHAFEPNPISFRKLSLHAELNAMPWLHVHQAATGSVAGETCMFSYNGGDDTATHMAYNGENTNQAPHSWNVKTLRLDDEVLTGRIRPPIFIKMDVEGHGHHALSGSRSTIAAHMPMIVAGLHSKEESAGIDELLIPLGYRRKTLEGNPAVYVSGQLDVVYHSDHGSVAFP